MSLRASLALTQTLLIKSMPRAKKCRICKTEFHPRTPMQIVCAPACGVEYAIRQRRLKDQAMQREDRQKTKARKEAIKTRADWADDAQKAFNAWIRARDIAAGYGCISCGTKNPNIQYAAGHFRSVKAAPHLRFNPDNVHLQCNKNCNSAMAGNVVEYRIELVKRIGIERVEALENDNTLHRYEIEELKAIRDEYRKKLKELNRD